MRTLLALSAVLVLLAGAKALGPWRPVGPSAYEEALASAAARSQSELEVSAELWVDHSQWENAWRVSSRRYTVQSTKSRYFAGELAQSLEAMYARFQDLTGKSFEPNERFQVFVFPDLTAYNAFGEDHGEEHSSFYGSFFAAGHPERPVATYVSPNPTLMRMWATHSAAHQFVAAAFGSEPSLPMAEGFAAYTTFWWDWNWAVDEYERLKSEDALVPLANLLDSDAGTFARNGHARLVELGMLFTYLITFREDTRTVTKGIRVMQAPFRDYLRGILAGSDVSASPVHELLNADLETLEQDFFAFDAWR